MKKFISVLLAFVMTTSLALPAFAAEERPAFDHKQDVVLTAEVMNGIKQLDAIGLDGDLIEKLLTVSNHIAFSHDQKTLEIDLSDNVLMNEYGFTEKQIADLKAILNGTYQAPSVSADFLNSHPASRAARFYLSNEQLTMGTLAVLATAAQAGGPALMAAWTGVSTALAGPLGTVAGISTAALGATFFADLAVKITGALVQGKGVAFYLDWGVPPVKTVIE